jgi:hypothetical protein
MESEVSEVLRNSTANANANTLLTALSTGVVNAVTNWNAIGQEIRLLLFFLLLIFPTSYFHYIFLRRGRISITERQC